MPSNAEINILANILGLLLVFLVSVAAKELIIIVRL